MFYSLNTREGYETTFSNGVLHQTEHRHHDLEGAGDAAPALPREGAASVQGTDEKASSHEA